MSALQLIAMEKSVVIHKIEQMPEGLMGIVSDFLDKLVQSFELGIKTGMELSKEEQQEILDALAEYKANPETGVQWDALKSRLLAQYELQ